MKEKRRIPYGVGNWAKLVRDDAYFYVDHTAYIRELEKFETPVFLRPRRFGKTMWCSILECYYDVSRKDDFGWLFGNLTEAFFQLTFCDLCCRNLSRFYTIHVEPNLHSGLADFVALPVSDDGRSICVVEFKYRKVRGAKGGVRRAGKPKARATVSAADKRQVAAYAADVAANYPGRTVEAYVAAIVGNRAYALSRVPVLDQ